MASETTQAAILILRAKALESYGVIKDLYSKQSQPGDSDKIASQALSLAQYEGAMVTLEQYFNNAQQPPPAEPEVGADNDANEENTQKIIGPEDSASMRRVMEVQEATRKANETNES